VRRLRVLHLIDNALDAGGAERLAVGIATHLPSERFEVWLCATRTIDAHAISALDEAGVGRLHLARETKWDVQRFRLLASLLRREHIDVLHAHMFGSNVWGTLIGRACRVPVVLAHEHSWSFEGEPLRRLIDGQLIGRLATRFVAVSSADAERMVKIEGVRPEKVVVVPAAYVPRPDAPSGDLRSELGIAKTTPLIATVAILRPEKALSVLLDAHARLLTSIPDAHVAIAGRGPCREELERHAGELGLDGRAHFLGYRRDVDAILRAADVATISSDREGSPLVVFECMANRTPLVATAVGGLRELVEDGRSGLLVPPRQPQAMADALARMLSDPSLREQMATTAAKRLQEFTIEHIAARFASLYEKLAEEAHLS
jgi:glycosyltransferase involved in cell wall biosynthesis